MAAIMTLMKVKWSIKCNTCGNEKGRTTKKSNFYFHIGRWPGYIISQSMTNWHKKVYKCNTNYVFYQSPSQVIPFGKRGLTFQLPTCVMTKRHIAFGFATNKQNAVSNCTNDTQIVTFSNSSACQLAFDKRKFTYLLPVW